MCSLALNHWGFEELLAIQVWLPGLLTSVLLMGSYPMTQIYQHEEDSRKGDRTLSLMLGIRGTFYFTAIFFLFANAGFYFYFSMYHSLLHFLLFQVLLLPTLLYFGWWYLRVHRDPEAADFKSTMRLNVISSLSMIAYFTLITFWS